MIVKDLEGGGLDQIEVLSRHLPKAAEENRKNPQSRWSVSQPRFEQSISRIPVQSVTDTLTCLSKYLTDSFNSMSRDYHYHYAVSGYHSNEL
jgi:hypothetical protein